MADFHTAIIPERKRETELTTSSELLVSGRPASLGITRARHDYNMCRDITNKQSDCAPSEDSYQPGHPSSLIRVFAVRMKKYWVLSYPLSAQRRLWSDWADAQADLSLRWAHTHFVGFVMSRLVLLIKLMTILVSLKRLVKLVGTRRSVYGRAHRGLTGVFLLKTTWAAAWQKQQNGMYAQRRLRSALESAQSDQSLRCPHDESLDS